MPSTVTAFLALPDLGPVHLSLPLSPLERMDVLALPAYSDAPSAFVPLTTSVLIGYDARAVTVAVFRTRTPDVFLAVPYSGDAAASRAHADALRSTS